MIIKQKEKISDVLSEFGNDLTQFEFMAMIYSTWHLNNLTVFMNERNLKNGLILILPQSNINDSSKFRLKESHFKSSYYTNCILVFINSTYSGLSIKNLIKRLTVNYMKARNPFFLVSPGGINFKVYSSISPAIKLTLVKIDEGTASYITSAQHKLFKKSVGSGVKSSRISPRYLLDVVSDKLKSAYLFLTRSAIVDYLLFQKNKGSFSINTQLAQGLKSYYNENSTDSTYSGIILFFKDFSIVHDEILEDFYLDLFNHLTKGDQKVLIKKHPNDTGKYFDELIEAINNVEIIDYSGSGEQLIADSKPKFVLGGFSTVMFTSPAIFQIKTISFNNYE